MITFDSANLYIECESTIAAKIEKIDAIIAALQTAALQSAGKSGIDEYYLDSGQTKIRAKYRSTSDIVRGIKDFELLKTMYVNQINGSVFRLIDNKSV